MIVLDALQPVEMMNLVCDLVCNDRSLTDNEMTEEVGLSYNSCQVILTEGVGMRYVSARLVPCFLTQEQKIMCR
jgi:hypothetical protein